MKQLLLLALATAVLHGCTSLQNDRAGTASVGGTLSAARVKTDFTPDGDVAKRVWRAAKPVLIDQGSRGTNARPDLATSVRALWSDSFLYLAYDCPFTKLTVYDPVQEKERFGLWERDVVEAFIGSDANDIKHYTEYEVSPTNERLDVRVTLPKYDFDWSSAFESATHVDDKSKRWTAEMKIPLSALSEAKPVAGAQWRINLYRCDYANKAFLAFNPTLSGSFHVPERFGVLEFKP